MVRGARLYLCISFVCSSFSLMAADILPLLESFLTQGGQEINILDNIKSLDFYTTNRIALSVGGVSLGFDLGAGCGSPFLPLPAAQRMYFDWNRDQPSGVDGQARSALLKVMQDQLFAALGGGTSEKSPIDFFAQGGPETIKQHPLERLFNFKITPGMIWAIKFGLLLKHMGQSLSNKEQNRFIQGFSYAADLGVLTIRLMRSLRRDSRVAGGISAVIEERLPVVGKILREVSTKYIPESQNPERNALFLHRKLDSFWKMIMDGDGIVFGSDGSVQKGLGFGVTGLECRTPQDAQFLSAFLNQKQINWDALETQTMVNKPFILRVATLAQMYLKQIEGLAPEVKATRAKDAAKLQEIVQDLVVRDAQKNLGRYDLDTANNVSIHPQLAKASFSALIGPGKVIDNYTSLPLVVAADKWVYFCTNQTGPVEAGKLVAIIFFHALWRYMEVIRGNKEMDADITAKIREKDRAQTSAQRYLQTPEASFLQLPLGLLLERPTVDFYALAGKFEKDKKRLEERDELVKKLIQATKENHVKAAVRVGNIYRKALEKVAKTKIENFDTAYPVLSSDKIHSSSASAA